MSPSQGIQFSADKKGLLLTLGLSFFMLLYFFGFVIKDPNNAYLGFKSDGFKNYYTPMYHVKHDSTYSWFEGMNYPHGEHLVFTDAQPLLANSIKWVSQNLIDLSGYTVGIMNLLMLLMFIPTALLLYLIFQRFQVDWLWGSLFAVGITFLSPQMHRLYGHYALTYMVVIPALWLMALQYFESPGLRRSLLLFLGMALLPWIQPYYLLIGAVFLSAYWLCQVLLHPPRQSGWMNILHFSIQVIAPMFLFQLLLSQTDPITDRPSSPYGFTDYRTHWESVFLPLQFPAIDVVKAFIGVRYVRWEGIAYVGALGIFSFLWFLFRSFREVVRRKWNSVFRFSANPEINVSVWAGILVLLFAMGIPFIWAKGMLEYIPFLKQFRSVGRFAWVFYYVWTVFTFRWVYLGVKEYWKKKDQGIGKVLGWVVLIGAVSVLYLEAGYHSWWISRKMHSRIPELADSENLLPENQWLNHVDHRKYGAILVLPYFHQGSENINITPKKGIDLPARRAFVASLKTGLPLLNVMMSRTSFGQSWENLAAAIGANELGGEEMNIPDEKDWLLIVADSLEKSWEKSWPEGTELLYQDEVLKVYGFSWRDKMKQRADFGVPLSPSLVGIGEGSDSLSNEGMDSLISEGGEMLENNPLEVVEKRIGFLDLGREQMKVGAKREVLLETNIPKGGPDRYELSVTLRDLRQDQMPVIRLGWVLLDEKGNQKAKEMYFVSEIVEAMNEQDLRVKFGLKGLSGGGKVQILLDKMKNKDEFLRWGDLEFLPKMQ